MNNGSALVATAAGEVGKRADKVGQLSGGSALRSHIADEATLLCTDAVGYSLLELLTGKPLKIVVGEIFELELVRRADEPVGERGRNNGVGKLPNLALRVLERTVTVNHNLYVLAGSVENTLLYVKN